MDDQKEKEKRAKRRKTRRLLPTGSDISEKHAKDFPLFVLCVTPAEACLNQYLFCTVKVLI